MVKAERPFTVHVEGNVCSGKSLFLEHYQEFKEVDTINQEIDANLFSNVYTGVQDWSSRFQAYALFAMFEAHNQSTTKPVKLMERSMYSYGNCFVPFFFKRDCISPENLQVFETLFKYAQKENDLHIDLIVYLKTSPEVAYARFKKLYRKNTMTLEDVKALHELHETWIASSAHPVLVLDGDKDDDAEVLLEYNKFEQLLKSKHDIGPFTLDHDHS